MNKLENDAGYMETIKRLKKENEQLRNAIKDYLDKNIATDKKLEELQHKVRKAIGQDESLIKENAELKQQIEKWKSGENISRGAIDLFVHEYNEYCLEENRKDYIIRDEDVEGFFDSLDPLELIK